MSQQGKGERSSHRTRTPHEVRLPGFVNPEQEVGLGDIIKKATASAGVRPCGGCSQRAETLNSWVVFTRR